MRVVSIKSVRYMILFTYPISEIKDIAHRPKKTNEQSTVYVLRHFLFSSLMLPAISLYFSASMPPTASVFSCLSYYTSGMQKFLNLVKFLIPFGEFSQSVTQACAWLEAEDKLQLQIFSDISICFPMKICLLLVFWSPYS